MLRFDFVTIFPEMIEPTLGCGIPRRAKESGLVDYSTVNPRDFTFDFHKTVDDSPYGGGPGMVMKPEPLEAAIESLNLPDDCEVIFTDPVGDIFTMEIAHELKNASRIVFVCGRYEGIDERVREHYATRALSLGDYILSGGELAALTMTDAIVRLIPGAIGKPGSLEQDSFQSGLLSEPQYTRPPVWKDLPVPEVLLSGNHQEIARWRRQQALLRTKKYRPDLFSKLSLSKDDENLLK
jgi:tRNA (guanine37-N1)-methyltransferase